MNKAPFPEFLVHVTTLPKSGLTTRLKASEREREAIAAHLGAIKVDKFNCLLTFARWTKDGVQVSGEFDVLVETPSPISLAPVPQIITTQFSAKYVPITSKLAKSQFNDKGEIIINIEDDDAPDIFEGDELDGWAISVEYAALELDPFARLPGEAFQGDSEGSAAQVHEKSPFAVLKKLKE